MSCGETNDKDTEMSFPLVLLETRGGASTVISGGEMRKGDEEGGDSTRRRANRLSSKVLFAALEFDNILLSFPTRAQASEMSFP